MIYLSTSVNGWSNGNLGFFKGPQRLDSSTMSMVNASRVHTSCVYVFIAFFLNFFFLPALFEYELLFLFWFRLIDSCLGTFLWFDCLKDKQIEDKSVNRVT